MQTGALASMLGEIESARRFLRVNEVARNLGSFREPGLEASLLEIAIGDLAAVGLSRKTWRVLDHCAAVNRAYAVFEQFVEAILGDWLSERSSRDKFGELPEQIRASYSTGLAEILKSMSHARYDYLSETDLIGGYNDALRGHEEYRLYPECLTYHRNNLRWSELAEIFGRCGIVDLSDWMRRSYRLKDFFESSDRIAEQAESKLAELIGYRNDASHGAVNVDEILGLEALEEIFDFVSVLGSEIVDLIRHKWAGWMLDIDEAKDVGRISEKFADNVRIAICQGVSLTTGQSLMVRKGHFCRIVSILSIQVEGVEQASVAIAGPQEVGLKLSEAVPLQCSLVIPNVDLDP